MAVVPALALALGSLAWAADLYRRAGFLLFNEQHLAIALAIALPLLYLSVPARKGPRTSVPWYDLLAAVMGFATSVYVTIRYPILLDRMIEVPLEGVIVSIIMVVLCLEGLRRTVGMTLVVVTLLLFAYAMVGHHIPGALQTKEVTAEKLVLYIGLDTSAMLRCLGAAQSTIIRLFTLEMLWLALLASSLGCGLGLLTQLVITELLDRLVLPGLRLVLLRIPSFD